MTGFRKERCSGGGVTGAKGLKLKVGRRAAIKGGFLFVPGQLGCRVLLLVVPVRPSVSDIVDADMRAAGHFWFVVADGQSTLLRGKGE